MSAARPGVTRRRFLAGLLLVPPVVAGCSLGGATADAPDPLIAMADAARADAALATAVIAASPRLAERVRPLVQARTEHAAALDAEVVRLDPGRTTAPTTSPAPPPRSATLTALRTAVLASGEAAATAVLDLPAARVGLVASVAACCSTYGAVLG